VYLLRVEQWSPMSTIRHQLTRWRATAKTTDRSWRFLDSWGRIVGGSGHLLENNDNINKYDGVLKSMTGNGKQPTRYLVSKDSGCLQGVSAEKKTVLTGRQNGGGQNDHCDQTAHVWFMLNSRRGKSRILETNLSSVGR